MVLVRKSDTPEGRSPERSEGENVNPRDRPGDDSRSGNGMRSVYDPANIRFAYSQPSLDLAGEIRLPWKQAERRRE
jgi:hypothetical protein